MKETNTPASIAQSATKAGPLRRNCSKNSNSACNTAPLQALDWGNWWQDNGYIHVKHRTEQTWHRVFPKLVKGCICNRIAVFDQQPHWLYDKTPS